MRAILLASLALAMTACASMDIQPRYAQPAISGTAGASSGGIGGSADVEQAGLDDASTLAGRLDFKFGSPHLVVLGQAPNFSGSGTMDATVSDGTNTIPAGAAVDTSIDLGMYDAALVFDLVPGDTVEAGLGLGVAYLDMSLDFTDQGSGNTVSTEERFPLPLLCGVASVWIGPVQLGGFAGGFQADYQGDSVHYVDADLYARWKLFGGRELLRGSLVLGYRLTHLDLQYADSSAQIDTDLSIRGPYVGFEASL